MSVMRLQEIAWHVGAVAVVDIHTVWRDHIGNGSIWKDRVCEVSKVGGEWKMTMHTGALE